MCWDGLSGPGRLWGLFEFKAKRMVCRTPLTVTRFLVFAGVLLSQQADATADKRSYSCYWVTGRLMAANGGTPVKIWPRNTNQMLGVINNEELPAEIRRLKISFDHSIWGDFRVCPTTKEQKGWMRFVIVTKGHNLKIVDYR